MKAKRYTNVNFPHIDGNVQLVWCQSLLISGWLSNLLPMHCVLQRWWEVPSVKQCLGLVQEPNHGQLDPFYQLWLRVSVCRRPEEVRPAIRVPSVQPLTRCWRRPWPGCRCCRRRPTPSSRWWRRCSPSASPARWSSSPECRSSAAKNWQKHVM